MCQLCRETVEASDSLCVIEEYLGEMKDPDRRKRRRKSLLETQKASIQRFRGFRSFSFSILVLVGGSFFWFCFGLISSDLGVEGSVGYFENDSRVSTYVGMR